jgi:CubicO group peptidase (beta-lactamase class C family)
VFAKAQQSVVLILGFFSSLNGNSVFEIAEIERQELERIIERVKGRDFETTVSDRVKTPFGAKKFVRMVNTFLFREPRGSPRDSETLRKSSCDRVGIWLERVSLTSLSAMSNAYFSGRPKADAALGRGWWRLQ